jgi:drug/metabolite transporter (DMT)-like permease
MVKSSIVGFSALFSVLFLSRRFIGREWISILAILVGAGMIVGSVHGNYLGPVYLLVAQFFVAGQFILEEYFMDHYHLDPVRAMGIEGMFSTLLLGGALVIAALFGRDEFDIKSGVQQVLGNSDLWQSALLLSFMVAIFNFFGLAVSTAVGVLGRSTLDALR